MIRRAFAFDAAETHVQNDHVQINVKMLQMNAKFAFDVDIRRNSFAHDP